MQNLTTDSRECWLEQSIKSLISPGSMFDGSPFGKAADVVWATFIGRLSVRK